MILNLNFLFIVELLGIGIISGALGSLLGIGGGVINVPFILQLGALPSVARSAGLILSSITGISSFLTHKKKGTITFAELVPFIPWALIGVLLGVSFQFIFKHVFPEVNYAIIFKGIFLVVLLVVLYKMIAQKLFSKKATREDSEECLENPHRDKNWFRALISAPGGFLAGLLGIGGGIYYGPMLKTVVKYPIKKAIPLSSGLIAISVPTGAILSNGILLLTKNYHLFFQSIIISAFIGMGTIIGVYLGVFIFKRLKPGILTAVYIFLIIFNAVKIFISILNR